MTDKKEPPGPRKRALQQRSTQLVRAIKEACLKILQQEGPDQLTTQRIADIAGVTIGSLYQSHPSHAATGAQRRASEARVSRQIAKPS